MDPRLVAEVENALHHSLAELVAIAQRREWGKGEGGGNAGGRVPRRPLLPDGSLAAAVEPPVRD